MIIERTYSELCQYQTFEERFDYLVLHGSVGVETFGHDRYINQNFYTSREWKNVRDVVIIRDNGCDLGIPGLEIHDMVLIHHINPMTADDVLNAEEWITNPEFLITTTTKTHNAIHFGDRSRLRVPHVERRAGDTKLW